MEVTGNIEAFEMQRYYSTVKHCETRTLNMSWTRRFWNVLSKDAQSLGGPNVGSWNASVA